MKEINKKTLIEALSALKQHNPPGLVWENINMELELGQEEIIPKKMLSELPEYEPPTKVWEKIERSLGQRQEAKIIPLKWRRALTVAASVILLAMSFFYFEKIADANDLNPDKIVLEYSVEEVDDKLLVNDWQEDAGDFELYKELCNAKKYICEHPEFQVLQKEFVELSEAAKELELAIGNYGTNADLITQIKEIELERTDIFKKMMVMLV